MNNNRTIKVALLGFGTVGSGVYEVIEHMQKNHFIHKVGVNIEVAALLDLRADQLRDQVEPHTKLTADWQEIVNDPDIDIVVEVIGGLEPARTFILDALNHGKNVVSANKDLIAVHGAEIMATAAANNKDFMFEAAALGAIPIVHPLQEGLLGSQISEVVGIMNGTTNYILSKMTSEKWDFDEALAEATRLGYAEADPTADIEGLDAGRKVAILANLACHTPAVFDDVYIEGITKMSKADIEYAERLGCVIKLLGIIRRMDTGIQLCVHPALISNQHPLAAVNDSFNAVFVTGDAVDEAMFYGRGAGKLPTAGAIVGDIIDITRNILHQCEGRVGRSIYENFPVIPMQDTRSRFFVRFIVRDTTGVLAAIGTCFGNANVSIAEMIQRETEQTENEDAAELVVITHDVLEGNFNQALRCIEDLPQVYKVDSIIRVYGNLK